MNIGIYAAASEHIEAKYIQETELLGELLAKAGHTLIYGAGATGLMGAVARGFTKGNGDIIGVAPHFMQTIEPIYDQCTDLIKTDTMAARKLHMEAKSDAFVILPGGIGTFDEFFQILTLRYLGQSDKEIIVYDMFGYYTKLLDYMSYCMDEGFIRISVKDLYKVAKSSDEVLDIIQNLK